MHAARAGGRCDRPLAHIIFFQAGKFFRQRHVSREIIPVEGVRVLWCLIKDDEFGHLVFLLETGWLTTTAVGRVHNAWPRRFFRRCGSLCSPLCDRFASGSAAPSFFHRERKCLFAQKPLGLPALASQRCSRSAGPPEASTPGISSPF